MMKETRPESLVPVRTKRDGINENIRVQCIVGKYVKGLLRSGLQLNDVFVLFNITTSAKTERIIEKKSLKGGKNQTGEEARARQNCSPTVTQRHRLFLSM